MMKGAIIAMGLALATIFGSTQVASAQTSARIVRLRDGRIVRVSPQRSVTFVQRQRFNRDLLLQRQLQRNSINRNLNVNRNLINRSRNVTINRNLNRNFVNRNVVVQRQRQQVVQRQITNQVRVDPRAQRRQRVLGNIGNVLNAVLVRDANGNTEVGNFVAAEIAGNADVSRFIDGNAVGALITGLVNRLGAIN